MAGESLELDAVEAGVAAVLQRRAWRSKPLRATVTVRRRSLLARAWIGFGFDIVSSSGATIAPLYGPEPIAVAGAGREVDGGVVRRAGPRGCGIAPASPGPRSFREAPIRRVMGLPPWVTGDRL